MNPEAWTSKSQLAVRCDFELTSPTSRSRSHRNEGEIEYTCILFYILIPGPKKQLSLDMASEREKIIF